MDIVTNITLDFAKQTFPIVVFAKQYDYNSRKIAITPLNNGLAYSIEEGITARIQATKPDGKTVINDCTIKNGKIIAEMTAQLLTVDGRVKAEIGLYQDDYCLSTQIFYICVEESAYDAFAVESSDEYGFIEGALEKAKEALEIAEDALEKAENAGGGTGGGSGQDGAGISSAVIDEDGELIIYLTDGKILNVGKVVGEDGQDGVSVVGASIVGGLLNLTLSNGETIVAGKVVGERGEAGVGIVDVTQSVTSTEDDGINIISIFTSDDKSYNFEVKNGSKGKTGANGKDGASVSITNITESTESGGNNVVSFNDGKTLTIKNGIKGKDGADGKNGINGTNGKDGKTPVKGTDYWTPEDKAEMVADVVASLDSVETAPDYVIAEAEGVIDRVVAAQSGRTFTFAAITDLHYGNSGYTDGVKHACQAMKYIDECIKLDAVAVLGDYTDGYPASDYDNAIGDFKAINKVLNDLRFAPNLRVQGNHDYYADHSAEINRFIALYSDDVIWGNVAGGYFYRDFDSHKLRVVCLNTTETGNNNISVSAEQINWFINSLDMSAKEDAAEWQILLLSHHPLDWWTTACVFGQIINAYKNGASWTDGIYSCDYTGKNSASLIANIHGHIHNLLTDTIFLTDENGVTKTSVYRMSTPNACYGRENQYIGGAWVEDTTYSKTQKSANDTAFVIYCLNLDTHTIQAICYGAGYDRTLIYSTGEIITTYTISKKLTNISISNTASTITAGESYSARLTSTAGDISSVIITMGGVDVTSTVYMNGNITIPNVTGNIVIVAEAEEAEEVLVNLLDTVGYTDNMRFSASSGTEKAEEGCVATGYIDVSDIDYESTGDAFYAWGADFNNANSSGKCVFVGYDEDKNVVGQGYLNPDSYGCELKFTFDDENRLVIKRQGNPTIKYMRFSGVGSGKNVVVTRNQLPN